MDAKDTGIAAILEKKAIKQAAAEDRKKERADKGEVNTLALERDEFGLYYVRYTAGGLVPEVLRNKFTRKAAILDVVRAHYGNTDLVVE
jgi:hypothetical protein